ncbi:MAG: HEAT repeat domain-containing protein [Myxococcaceae bacterium]
MPKARPPGEYVSLLSSRKAGEVEEAREALSAALSAEDEGLKENAARLLLEELARPGGAVAEVLGLLQSGWWPPSPRLSGQAMRSVLLALGGVAADAPEVEDASLVLANVCREDPYQLASLEQALGDARPTVRRAAAGAAGRIGESALGMVPRLIEALEDSSDPVAGAAIESLCALASLAPMDVAPALVEQVRRGEGVRRYLALATLRGLLEEAHREGQPTPSGLESLGAAALPALEDPEPSARLEAAGLLGVARPSSAAEVAALRRHLGDTSPDVAAHAATALLRLGASKDEAVRTLGVLLHDENPERHGAALDALEGLETAVLAQARATLEEAAREAPAPVREAAKALLDTFG